MGGGVPGNINIETFNVDDLYVGGYDTNAYLKTLHKQTTTDYIEPLEIGADESTVKKVVKKIDYQYSGLYSLPIKTITTNSDGKQQIIKNHYPGQSANVADIGPVLTTEEIQAKNKLHAANRLSPIQVESYEKVGNKPEVMLSAQRSLYKTDPITNFTQLKSVSSSKNSADFEERVVYHKYDDKGNPLELSKADGTKVVYQWATNHRKPMTKIVNANLLSVQNAQGDLRIALPNAQVTNYTYTGPLNLLSTVTDPRGYTTTYKYDKFNRLEFVIDAEGNILSKNEYNYRPQN